MNFYEFDRNTPMGFVLGRGLDGLRSALNDLTRINADFGQMSDAQIVSQIGVKAAPGGNTALQQAAAFKAEMASDVSKLLTDASQSGVAGALNQLLAQTG